ncbi:MAG: UvrB/UvrC motif-containing protein, partial [Oscillospiraceae bacterium]
RKIQNDYNIKNNIVPKTIIKEVRDIIEISTKDIDKKIAKLTKREKNILIDKMTKEMKQASKMLDFEYAAILRDKIKNLTE